MSIFLLKMLHLTNNKVMKKFFALLVVVIAAMCFAPKAGATTVESLVIPSENVVNASETQVAQDKQVVVIVKEVDVVIVDDKGNVVIGKKIEVVVIVVEKK